MSTTTAETQPKNSVSVVGLGLMGAALARAFIAKGYRTTVWNRSPEKAAPLTSQGAILETSATACAKASPLVVVCLTNSDAIQAAFKADQGSVEGRGHVMVNLTSGCPSQVRGCRDLASSMGFDAYIHGSIMTFPQWVGLPESFFYYSGNEAAFRSVEKDLTTLGTPVYLDDDEISSALQEVVLTGAAYGSWAGFLQSMALLRTSKAFKSGSVTAQSFVQDTVKPLLADSLKIFEAMARQIDEQDYKATPDGARCSVHLASLRSFSQTYREQGVSSDIITPLLQLVAERVSQGGEDDELSAIVELISNQSTSSKAWAHDGLKPSI